MTDESPGLPSSCAPGSYSSFFLEVASLLEDGEPVFSFTLPLKCTESSLDELVLVEPRKNRPNQPNSPRLGVLLFPWSPERLLAALSPGVASH